MVKKSSKLIFFLDFPTCKEAKLRVSERSSATPLAGARIGLTGARKAPETAEFVRRLGGIPIVAPVLATTSLDGGEVSPNRSAGDSGDVLGPDQAIDAILAEDLALVVFLTGVGVRALLALADRQGRRPEVVARLARTTVVARGPKAHGALKGAGIPVTWLPREATVAAILAELDRFDVAGRTALVQLSGFPDGRLRVALTARGARVRELNLYEHVRPADEGPVLALLDAVETGEVDFLTFTSAIAVRGFFAIAESHGRDDPLLAALRSGRVTPVAVGPVTAAALAEVGAPATIVPSTPTTGGMFRAIEEWLARRRASARALGG